MPMTDPQKPIQERLTHNNWGILGNQGYILGVDLGGYGLRVALVNLQSQTYTSIHAHIPLSEPHTMLAQTMPVIHQLLDNAGVATNRLVRIGVGFGGPIDPDRGVVLLSPRVHGWENFSLKETFEQTFDTVTLVDNDANLIALGEANFGIGYGCKHLFYLHLSSGVGGGIVLDGRLYHGATTTAGEIGHAVVGCDWNGQEDQKKATLEELVSLSNLLQRARLAGFSTNNLADLFSDDPIAQRIIAETIDLLAMRIAHVVALLDPQMIVLGGVLVRIGGDNFVQAIGEQMVRYIAPALARPVQVVSSVLGTESIVVGAIAMALESLHD